MCVVLHNLRKPFIGYKRKELLMTLFFNGNCPDIHLFLLSFHSVISANISKWHLQFFFEIRICIVYNQLSINCLKFLPNSIIKSNTNAVTLIDDKINKMKHMNRNSSESLFQPFNQCKFLKFR